MLPIAARLVATDLKAAARRLKRNTLLYAVMGLLLFTAYACGVAGVLMWVATEWGPVAAAFVLAAAFAAAALVVLAIMAAFNAADRRRSRRNAAGQTALYASVALAALPLLTRSKLAGGAALAGVAAFVVMRAMGDSDHEGSTRTTPDY